MKIEINTSVNAATSAHYILNRALESLLSHPGNLSKLNISKSNAKDAEKFLKASTKGLLKAIKAKRGE